MKCVGFSWVLSPKVQWCKKHDNISRARKLYEICRAHRRCCEGPIGNKRIETIETVKKVKGRSNITRNAEHPLARFCAHCCPLQSLTCTPQRKLSHVCIHSCPFFETLVPRPLEHGNRRKPSTKMSPALKETGKKRWKECHNSIRFSKETRNRNKHYKAYIWTTNCAPKPVKLLGSSSYHPWRLRTLLWTQSAKTLQKPPASKGSAKQCSSIKPQENIKINYVQNL